MARAAEELEDDEIEECELPQLLQPLEPSEQLDLTTAQDVVEAAFRRLTAAGGAAAYIPGSAEVGLLQSPRPLRSPAAADPQTFALGAHGPRP